MKPKLLQKIAEDMKSRIPIKVEISYGAIEIDRDFLKLLNKKLDDKKGSFHTDENCDTITHTNPISCSCGSGNKSIYSGCLIVRLNNNKATNPDELERMFGDFNYFSKKFPGMFWEGYVSIKDKKNNGLCDWTIASSSYEELEKHDAEPFFESPSCAFTNNPEDKPFTYRTESALKTAIRNCPSRGKTCKYLRRISSRK